MLGTVTALRRYPVKSMLGEDVAVSEVSRAGLRRDRALALVHRKTGKVASAKNPRLWRGLLTLSATATDSGVRIALPDGRTRWDTDSDVEAVLSELLGQPVELTDTPPPEATLERAEPEEVLRDGEVAQVPVEVGRLGASSPGASFFDFAPLHLLTTSTLDRIAELSPGGSVETERYRPNIVVRTSTSGFEENDWTDRDLRIGDDLTLRVVARTPRCAVPTLVHGELPRNTSALRVLADHNRVSPLESVGAQPCAGAYAQVSRPGTIRLGDPVRFV